MPSFKVHPGPSWIRKTYQIYSRSALPRSSPYMQINEWLKLPELMQGQVDNTLKNFFFFRFDAAKFKVAQHPLGLPFSQQRQQHINRPEQPAS